MYQSEGLRAAGWTNDSIEKLIDKIKEKFKKFI